MRSRARHVSERLRTSYWFVPTMMAFGAGSLAFASLQLDEYMGSGWGSGWFYSGGPEGAREVLSVAAGSMITVAGVTFSIMIVALSLASQQLGPRLLRSFMRDLGTQVTLGTFVATFLFNLVVLRTIYLVEGEASLPNVSVTIGVVLALASLGVLIYFVHHVSVLIQANSVLFAVGQDLFEAIDELYPEGIGECEVGPCPGSAEVPAGFDEESCRVDSTIAGHVQAIDRDELMSTAKTHDLLIRIESRPGKFVTNGTVLARAWPRERASDTVIASLRDTFMIGQRQTLEQDAEFAVQQLAEVAVRALSTGMNDPFTAITAIDWLGAGLCRLAQRSIPSPYCRDNEGRLRVIASPVTFVGIANAGFNHIRQYGRGQVGVMIRLLETIETVAQHVRREEDRQALMRQATMIERASHEAVGEELDRMDIRGRYEAAIRTLCNR